MNRGKCPVCFYRFRLRKDGTLQAHCRPDVYPAPAGALQGVLECTGSLRKPMSANGAGMTTIRFKGDKRLRFGEVLAFKKPVTSGAGSSVAATEAAP